MPHIKLQLWVDAAPAQLSLYPSPPSCQQSSPGTGASRLEKGVPKAKGTKSICDLYAAQAEASSAATAAAARKRVRRGESLARSWPQP